MADYNVNMKQWNGTSFDNVLPLAYNAKQLGGQSLAEVKQWVQDNGLLLYTGQYVGTGTYGESNPTVITCGFKPKMIVFALSRFDATSIQNSESFGLIEACSGGNLIGWIEGVQKLNAGNYKYLYFSQTDVGLQFYCDANNAAAQNNQASKSYCYIAIGGYDMGGQNSSRHYVYHHIQPELESASYR